MLTQSLKGSHGSSGCSPRGSCGLHSSAGQLWSLCCMACLWLTPAETICTVCAGHLGADSCRLLRQTMGSPATVGPSGWPCSQ